MFPGSRSNFTPSRFLFSSHCSHHPSLKGLPFSRLPMFLIQLRAATTGSHPARFPLSTSQLPLQQLNICNSIPSPALPPQKAAPFSVSSTQQPKASPKPSISLPSSEQQQPSTPPNRRQRSSLTLLLCGSAHTAALILFPFLFQTQPTAHSQPFLLPALHLFPGAPAALLQQTHLYLKQPSSELKLANTNHPSSAWPPTSNNSQLPTSSPIPLSL